MSRLAVERRPQTSVDVTFARFVSALRNAEVRVSPAETLTAFDVVRRVGIADQALLKDSLALALAKSKAEKSRFDDTFDRFFFQLAFREPAKRTFLAKFDAESDRRAALEALQDELPADLIDAVAAVLNDDRSALAARVQQVADALNIHEISSLREKSVFSRQIAQALAVPELDAYVPARDATTGGGEGGGISDDLHGLLRYLRHYFHEEIRAYVDAQYRLHADASGKRAIVDAALKSNLNQLPQAYHDEVRRVVKKLADKLAKEHRRRARQTDRGVLDLKRTLRRNVAYDGSVFDLRWRQQKRERATVFVLCDVSSSVARVARFLLLFLYELTDVLPSIRAFAFSSRLGEITDIMRANPSETAIEEALFSWGKGNTDYARAFMDFRELCGMDLNARSTLIVLGDGRNNYYDPRPDVFKDLSRRAKQTYWLNPETRDQWREGDSEMRRYAPHCFRVETCNKIRDIERFADRLLVAAR